MPGALLAAGAAARPSWCLLIFVKLLPFTPSLYSYSFEVFNPSIRMPGRVSTRLPTASRVSHKASTQILASRKSTTSPTIVVPDEGPTSDLRTQICNVFSDAQKSAAGHRKLIVGLRKIQEACCYEPTGRGKPSRQEFNEDDFNVEIARCVIRLIGVKRSEAVGDRIVRFLGFYLRYASEKGRKIPYR